MNDEDKIDIIFQTESSVERKVLSLLVFVLSGYSMLTALQFIITFALLDFPNWINQTITDPVTMYVVILFPLVTGLCIILGIFIRKLSVVKWGLAGLGVYHLLMALLNGIAYSFQGAPFFPYLMVGVIALVLFAYYSERGPSQDLTRGDIEAILPERNDDD